MATYIKIPDFLESFMELEINAATDSFMIALSNVAPASETNNPLLSGNGILANVTQISYTNYTDTLTVDRTLEGETSNEAAGVYTFDFSDFTITATGGPLAAWRYMYVYDDTATTPADPLVCVIDNGSAISLASGESRNVVVNAAGLFTIT